MKTTTLALLFASLAHWVAGSVDVAEASRPNIIFILTDDQDARMNSLDYMYGVQANMINKGASYLNHFCTVALCCPSRVNIWTGRAAHNTNVTSVSPPYGGYQQFAKQGLNKDWLPLWMQQAGYQNYYAGKLMNGFGDSNYDSPHPSGFNGSQFLCGGGTYDYYAPTYQRNKDKPVNYTGTGNYTTDLTLKFGMGFLDDARQSKQPFFLTMAPIAPHGGFGYRPPGVYGAGAIPNAKYTNVFTDVKVPRTENFNPSVESGSSWLLNLTRLNDTAISDGDMNYVNRIQALQSVDEMVNATFAYLEKYNLLDNTYVIYSTDNGFHISQHRLFPGKNCPYEEDINVPLIIRGPGIAAGQSVSVATTHTDIAATILTMGKVPLPDYLDGTPLPLIATDPVEENFEHAAIEHWGSGGSDDVYEYLEAPGYVNTTYKALRILGTGYNYYYSVWCTNQHELYDMTADPYQMNNLYAPYSYQPGEVSNASTPYPVNRLESRLDALLLVLKGCKASTCIKPWLALHPDGSVSSLPQAMNPKYDLFYEEQQNRVSYNWCDQGYIVAAEGPQTYLQYGSS